MRFDSLNRFGRIAFLRTVDYCGLQITLYAPHAPDTQFSGSEEIALPLAESLSCLSAASLISARVVGCHQQDRGTRGVLPTSVIGGIGGQHLGHRNR